MSQCISDFYIYDKILFPKSEFSDEVYKGNKTLYEVIRIEEGVPLFFQEHYNRLLNSADIMNMKINYSKEEILQQLRILIASQPIKEGNVKLIFNFEREGKLYAYFIKHFYPTERMYKEGVYTIFYHGERVNPNAKVINSSFRSEVEDSIIKADAVEAILVDNSGFITEGSKSNIFLVKGEQLFTAPLEAVLPGVTRTVIIECAKRLNLKCIEEKISYKDIKEFDALFISGTSPKILPIKQVENMYFNSSNNKIVLALMKIYDETAKENIKSYKV